MGVNLDDVLGNKKEEILVDKAKRRMNMLLIGTGIVVILIVIVAIMILQQTNEEKIMERAASITRDAEKLSNAVKALYQDHITNGTELVGILQEDVGSDKLIERYVRNQRLEFRHGYYFINRDQAQSLVSNVAPLEAPADYVVKYVTGEVVNLDGVNYKGTTYYEVDDLSAIARRKVNKNEPIPSDYSIFINSPEDMRRIAENPDAIIRLNADIDMSKFQGDGWTPVSTFRGIFDGRGYKISGLKINNSSLSNVGLFGRLESGSKVRNLVLENVDVSGGDHTGAIAGSCGGEILNCSATGSVNGNNYVGGLFGTFTGSAQLLNSEVNVHGHNYVGGFAGQMTNGTISQCRVKSYGREVLVSGSDNYVGGFIGEINGNNNISLDQVCAVASVSGRETIGGLVGTLNAGNGGKEITIRNTYSQGRIASCEKNAGGFAGEITAASTANTNLINCYTNCKTATNTVNRGGFVGYVAKNINITYCYWEHNSRVDDGLDESGVGNNRDTSIIFIGLDPSSMKLQSAFSGWSNNGGFDFWYFDGMNAPILKWER